VKREQFIFYGVCCYYYYRVCSAAISLYAELHLGNRIKKVNYANRTRDSQFEDEKRREQELCEENNFAQDHRPIVIIYGCIFRVQSDGMMKENNNDIS